MTNLESVHISATIPNHHNGLIKKSDGLRMETNRALESSLMDVPMRVDVALGEARMPIEDLMALSEGDILALERDTNELVDIYVSDRLMARGRLVIADGELGVTLSEIVDERAGLLG